MDDRGKATQFKPGQSGNPAGRPRGKTWKQVLSELEENKKEELREVAYAMALKGSVPALDWLVKHSGESGAGPGVQVGVETKSFTIQIAVPTDDDVLVGGDDEEALAEPLILPAPDVEGIEVVEDELGADEEEEIAALAEATSILADEPDAGLPDSVWALIAAAHASPDAAPTRQDQVIVPVIEAPKDEEEIAAPIESAHPDPEIAAAPTAPTAYEREQEAKRRQGQAHLDWLDAKYCPRSSRTKAQQKLIDEGPR